MSNGEMKLGSRRRLGSCAECTRYERRTEYAGRMLCRECYDKAAAEDFAKHGAPAEVPAEPEALPAAEPEAVLINDAQDRRVASRYGHCEQCGGWAKRVTRENCSLCRECYDKAEAAAAAEPAEVPAEPELSPEGPYVERAPDIEHEWPWVLEPQLRERGAPHAYLMREVDSGTQLGLIERLAKSPDTWRATLSGGGQQAFTTKLAAAQWLRDKHVQAPASTAAVFAIDAPPLTLRALALVAAERARQRARWGDEHDERHTGDEWRGIIAEHTRRLGNSLTRVHGYAMEGKLGTAGHQAALAEVAGACLPVAALAVAVWEACERNTAAAAAAAAAPASTAAAAPEQRWQWANNEGDVLVAGTQHYLGRVNRMAGRCELWLATSPEGECTHRNTAAAAAEWLWWLHEVPADRAEAELVANQPPDRAPVNRCRQCGKAAHSVKPGSPICYRCRTGAPETEQPKVWMNAIQAGEVRPVSELHQLCERCGRGQAVGMIAGELLCTRCAPELPTAARSREWMAEDLAWRLRTMGELDRTRKELKAAELELRELRAGRRERELPVRPHQLREVELLQTVAATAETLVDGVVRDGMRELGSYRVRALVHALQELRGFTERTSNGSSGR